MQFTKLFLASALTLVASTSYAMLCPNNFNTINPGDSLESVIQKCGKPVSQKASESQPNVPQEWTYYIRAQPTDAATVKATVGLVGGKVVNVSVNNVNLASSGICGPTISVGDDKKAVEAACGKPAFITQNNGPTDQVQKSDAATKDVAITYTTGMDQVTLNFVDGKLTNQK